jgi:hypothetical protein
MRSMHFSRARVPGYRGPAGGSEERTIATRSAAILVCVREVL